MNIMRYFQTKFISANSEDHIDFKAAKNTISVVLDEMISWLDSTYGKFWSDVSGMLKSNDFDLSLEKEINKIFRQFVSNINSKFSAIGNFPVINSSFLAGEVFETLSDKEARTFKAIPYLENENLQDIWNSLSFFCKDVRDLVLKIRQESGTFEYLARNEKYNIFFLKKEDLKRQGINIPRKYFLPADKKNKDTVNSKVLVPDPELMSFLKTGSGSSKLKKIINSKKNVKVLELAEKASQLNGIKFVKNSTLMFFDRSTKKTRAEVQIVDEQNLGKYLGRKNGFLLEHITNPSSVLSHSSVSNMVLKELSLKVLLKIHNYNAMHNGVKVYTEDQFQLLLLEELNIRHNILNVDDILIIRNTDGDLAGFLSGRTLESGMYYFNADMICPEYQRKGLGVYFSYFLEVMRLKNYQAMPGFSNYNGGMVFVARTQSKKILNIFKNEKRFQPYKGITSSLDAGKADSPIFRSIVSEDGINSPYDLNSGICHSVYHKKLSFTRSGPGDLIEGLRKEDAFLVVGTIPNEGAVPMKIVPMKIIRE